MVTPATCQDCSVLLDPQIGRYHHDIHDDLKKLKKQVKALEERLEKLDRS